MKRTLAGQTDNTQVICIWNAIGPLGSADIGVIGFDDDAVIGFDDDAVIGFDVGALDGEYGMGGGDEGVPKKGDFPKGPSARVKRENLDPRTPLKVTRWVTRTWLRRMRYGSSPLAS